MKFKLFLMSVIYFISLNCYSVTECNEKIVNYFIGTSQINQAVAHLWVSFEGGGSASVSSESSAFDGMLSTVMMSMAAEKTVKLRYFSDNVDCKIHHSDWVGLWIIK